MGGYGRTGVYRVILTATHRAAVRIIAKGCVVAHVLPLRCFFILLPNYGHVNTIVIEHFHILTR